MKLPSTIKVGFHTYPVEFPVRDGANIVTASHHDGNNLIRITDTINNEPMADSAILECLMHEILHAIDRKSNLRLFSEGDEGDTNENKLDGLAEWLCMVLYDNQELLGLFKKP